MLSLCQRASSHEYVAFYGIEKARSVEVAIRYFQCREKGQFPLLSRISDPISRKFHKTINNFYPNSPFELKIGQNLDGNMFEKMLETDF